MRRSWFGAAAVVTALIAGLPLRGDDFLYQKVYYVRVGDRAPEIECHDATGKLWRSKDHFGKKPVVLVFYMGDFMPASDKRLCTYRDYYPALTGLGAEVIAISGDAPENHEQFQKANRINFPLMVDAEAKASKEFGVYASSGGITKTKDAAGKAVRYKRNATLANWTFVIGTDGRVIYKDTQPDPTGDSRKVYELLYRLSSARQ